MARRFAFTEREQNMISVNQEDMEWEPGMTVQDILDRRRYTFPLILVKVNGELVHKDAYATYQVEDGSDVKVIHLISGG
jgi:sulfur carrier protein